MRAEKLGRDRLHLPCVGVRTERVAQLEKERLALLALTQPLFRAFPVGDVFIEDDDPVAACGIDECLEPAAWRSVLMFETSGCPRLGDRLEGLRPHRVDEGEDFACPSALRLIDGDAEQALEGRVQLQVKLVDRMSLLVTN
ncbi:hypothetical protein LRS10_23745 [Phenylobacterium sp. J426]|nr:hypothetical protein [Phenylobacterium sp. J426]MCR5876903.1 hypothetical protein [Phenylobacterium sp. J426]